MLERINNNDFRFRLEDENTLLALNVITSEMIFLRGSSKEYIMDLLNNKSPRKISENNMNILKNKKIIGD